MGQRTNEVLLIGTGRPSVRQHGWSRKQKLWEKFREDMEEDY